MPNPLRSGKNADIRPRIHIWPADDRSAWSFGPTGTRFNVETPGAAVDEALERIGHEAAVIIWEGKGG